VLSIEYAKRDCPTIGFGASEAVGEPEPFVFGAVVLFGEVLSFLLELAALIQVDLLLVERRRAHRNFAVRSLGAIEAVDVFQRRPALSFYGFKARLFL